MSTLLIRLRLLCPEPAFILGFPMFTTAALSKPVDLMMGLGVRAVACRQWQRMPGMVDWCREPNSKALRYTETDIDQGHVWLRGIPDLRDPATMGWLLSFAGLDASVVAQPAWLGAWVFDSRGRSLAEAAIEELESFPPHEEEVLVFLERTPKATAEQDCGFAQSEIGCRTHVPDVRRFAAELALLGARTAWPGANHGRERPGDDWLNHKCYALPAKRAPEVRALFDTPDRPLAWSAALDLVNPVLEIVSTSKRSVRWWIENNKWVADRLVTP